MSDHFTDAFINKLLYYFSSDTRMFPLKSTDNHVIITMGGYDVVFRAMWWSADGEQVKDWRATNARDEFIAMAVMRKMSSLLEDAYDQRDKLAAKVAAQSTVHDTSGRAAPAIQADSS